MVQAQLSRQEVVDVLQEIVGDQGPEVTLREFIEQTGIAESQIRKHFGSWTALRQKQGCTGRDRKQHSDEQLWEAYHALVDRLGRFPTQREIDQESPFASRTYYVRFGAQSRVKAEYRQWLARQASGRRKSPDENESASTLSQINRQETCNKSEDSRPPLAEGVNDMTWLRNQWQRVRVAFELRSSELRNRSAYRCDLLVVLEHDWPACPVTVLRVSDLMPKASNAEPDPTEERDDEPTRAELYSRMPWEEELIRQFP